MEDLRVIIADDHQIFRQGLDMLLRKLYYIKKVKHAANGNDVLKLLENGDHYDIVFMDINMPEMNGEECCKVVTEKYPKIKVIALTMMEDKGSIVRMFKMGASGNMLKNTSMKDIQEAIRKVRLGKRYADPEVSDLIMNKTLNLTPVKRKGPYNDNLSEREREIIKMICEGMTSKEAGKLLNIAEKTVESHRARIYTKLKIKKVQDLIYFAMENGIIEKK